MQTAVNRWVRISIVNLFIVSLLGVTLRYKISFPLPIVNQKFLLHAHSHFAFAGWISQVLMALVVQYLSGSKTDGFKDYQKILMANLVTAYGMLLSFPFQGYGIFSIIFSTLNIFTGYWFAIRVWRDLKEKPTTIAYWIKAGVLFNAVSSIGAFTLAFIMATKLINEKIYLGAIYFFLHFQYNGWFLFTSIGLFTEYLLRAGIKEKIIKNSFWVFFFACILTFFLSATWITLPVILRILVTIAAVGQFAAYLYIGLSLKNTDKKDAFNRHPGNYLFVLSGLALGIKLILQIASTYPPLSIYIFGFRPIIIGYLHLIFLGVITLFIIGTIINKGYIQYTPVVVRSVKIFTAGIILNELLLMIQGATALGYITLPNIDKFLLVAALIIFTSLLVLNTSLLSKKEQKSPLYFSS